jgi:hypothetical protein
MKHIFTVFILLFTISTQAQVGIGTSTPDASAQLEVSSTSKGLLIPQIALTGSSDATTIASPASSLLVYNTATTSDVLPGYYYNSGTTSSPVWLRLNTGCVPYTGASSEVDLGAYDLTVNGLTVGKGSGNFSSNTAIGVQALDSNNTGSNNTASGYYTLVSNIDGIGNTASGSQALAANTTGSYNTASGSQALYSNTTGSYNTASGSQALYANTIGNFNIASGYQALYSNTTGSNNTAIGGSALQTASTGVDNTAIGYNAGFNLTTGGNNTLIGFDAQPSTSTINNEITLGNSSVTTLRSQATTITSLSDRRDKTDIIPIVEGLAFLKQLNPVIFTWNTRDKAKVGIKSAGFIAQELLALQKQSNIGDNLDLVSEDNPEKLEARYGNLLPVIVKAIQEESAEKDQKIKELNERLDALEKQITLMLKK